VIALDPITVRAAAIVATWTDLSGVRAAPTDLLTVAITNALHTSPNGDLRDDDVERVCRLALERAEHERMSQ
jgi:hypothetical protein